MEMKRRQNSRRVVEGLRDAREVGAEGEFVDDVTKVHHWSGEASVIRKSDAEPIETNERDPCAPS